jgi:hypothetical protein
MKKKSQFDKKNEEFAFQVEVNLTKRSTILTPNVCSTWFRINSDNIAELQYSMILEFNRGIENLQKEMKFAKK